MVALVERNKPLRLADPADRRIFSRRPASGIADASRLDHSLPARRQPRICLELRDLSIGGISARSDAPMLTGERVIVHVPPQFNQPRLDAFGRVVRCQPSATGYHVAVEFDTLPAA